MKNDIFMDFKLQLSFLSVSEALYNNRKAVSMGRYVC